MPKFDYTPFRAEVKKRMVLQKISDYYVLSELASCNYRTLKSFMSGQRDGAKTALAIKQALKIRKKFGFEPIEKE